MKKNSETKQKKKFELPHIFVLLSAIILVCAIATWLLPAGEFERAVNEAGTEVVVPGTYHTVESSPVGLFDSIKAIYNGMLNGADVIFFVFIAYAAIGLIISTGAFNGLVAGLLKVLKGKTRAVIIPIFILVLGCASSTIGVFEEAFPFIPIFVGIAIALGYDAVVGLAIVALGTGLGYSGAVMNPFTVGMAQSIAGLPQMSGIPFRLVCHLTMIVVASAFTIRYALKVQADPAKSLVHGDSFDHLTMNPEEIEKHPFGIREKLVLGVLAAGIAVIVWGTKVKGWYFEDLSGVFLIMGIISSLIMGWGPNIIAKKVARSFADSGQAVTSMPIMAPLADLCGISRQVAVLAFQFGDGLSNIIWPTAMTPIMCGIAGVKMDKWWKFIVPLFLILLVTQGVLIAIATCIW